MRQIKALLAFLITLTVIPVGFAQSPAGTWTSIDDKTGKKRVVVDLKVSGKTLTGTIVKVFPQPGDTGICSKCSGNLKNKPIQGLRIIWGLKDKGNGVWEDGKILDPKSGRVYHAKMTLEGNKLHVRGYVGFSAFGRTQIWVR
ncbi:MULTISPECIES: DUF2147 domain-containing protein [Legionella]|uniref:Putative signal peptide protein n=1 Tax=Legionella drozanskii LLAP-1 TaxID=1212489 RepID=A0A0W0SPQ8_9GAMM|nr:MULTISPECIES: DUF2147 domain-containing protein [Legionella]KTC85359.1 putative signal peptide protein [Legionella drozanskii LLAP-1]PJE13981.1 MAG: DUF2147 domain-containing protein [Legionella sp.]